MRLSGDIDVHIVTYEGVPSRGRLPGGLPSLPHRRRFIAAAVAVVLLSALTVVLTQLRDQLALPSVILLYLLAVVAVALLGGIWPALAGAVAASLLINYYFTQPLYSFTVFRTDDVVAIAVFVLVALLVSSVVEVAARLTAEASRAAAEAQTLSVLAGSVLRGETAVPALLERLRETFEMTSVTLLQRDDSASWPPRPGQGRRWAVVTAAGTPPCHAPAEADTEMPVGDDLRPGTARARPSGGGPAHPRRVRRAGRGRDRTAAAHRGRGRRQTARGSRPDQGRPAGGGKPRVADAAGVGEGGRGQPA